MLKTVELLREDPFLLPDFFDFFCGELLGEGESRRVYEFKQDNSLVVKIDLTSDHYNIAEWENWNNIRSVNKKFAEKYFAPCISISECGKIMLQRRTYPLPDDYKLPKKLPYILWDLKKPNWGLINGTLKCHDYANSRLYHSINTKLVDAKWYKH